MVLVVRTELGLSPGKTAAQVAHAAVMLTLEGLERGDKRVKPWLSEGQKKVVLKARTLDEMEVLRKKALGQGLRAMYVEDAGLTEIPPGTKTVLGIGPALTGEVDKVTGTLPLL